MDLLQSKVHPNIPLRINPTEIRPYTPTKKRINDKREIALKNQYTVLNIWLDELHKRFSPSELTTPQHMISLGMQKMRYIFDTPKMPKIGKMREKKGQKSNQNVSHRYGKKIIL